MTLSLSLGEPRPFRFGPVFLFPFNALLLNPAKTQTCVPNDAEGILLDFPSDNATVNTVPHISTFRAESIEDFSTGFVDGRKVLTRVHLSSDEQWEDADVTYELILEAGVYQFRRFIRDQHKNRVDVGDNHIPNVNGKPLDYIPFLMVSHEGLRPEHVSPPFLSLCKVAISHFKNSADREHAIFLTASPTPWVVGSIPADKVPTQIGSGAVWTLPEGTEVGMLEFTGAGVAAMREIMEEKSETMISLGARMLGHVVDSGVVGAYQRSDRLEMRRSLLSQWQDFLSN